MKIFTIITLLMLSALASAQNFQNMTEADMQKMMQQAEKMQACMAGIDQSEMKKFEQQANRMQAKVDALCASGKRDEAEKEAMAFGKEVASNEAMQKMQACGKMMEGMMPGMPTVLQDDPGEDDNRHICDN